MKHCQNLKSADSVRIGIKTKYCGEILIVNHSAEKYFMGIGKVVGETGLFSLS